MVVSIAGYILIRKLPSQTQLYTVGQAHGVIGWTILALGLSQSLLGILSDRLYNPNRTSIPLQDRIHHWFGRMVVVLSWTNIPLGLVYCDTVGFWEIRSVLYVLYGFWLLLIIVVFGLQIRSARKGETKKNLNNHNKHSITLKCFNL